MVRAGPGLAVALLAVTALLVLSGCGDTSVVDRTETATVTAISSGAAASGVDPTFVVREAGTLIVPVESLEDIARWGSSVLVVSVMGENARNTSSVGPGEVELGRDLGVRVERVVWQHPQAVTTVSVGDQLSIYTFPGFVEINGHRSPASAQGAVRMEVGQRYVVTLTDDIADDAQVLTLVSTFVLQAGAIHLPDPPALAPALVAAELQDLSADQGDTGPEEGESLLQRVERVGQPR